jgi:hypothetical protein
MFNLQPPRHISTLHFSDLPVRAGPLPGVNRSLFRIPREVSV